MGRLRECCCCGWLVRWGDNGGGTDDERATRRLLLPVLTWLALVAGAFVVVWPILK
eukprot:gene14922-21364_t